ncbi:MAG: hypothetical protein KJ069_20690 [Anaerolineae bacterium]|nr:hypothetical protein [Anaerolineae bacterium]
MKTKYTTWLAITAVALLTILMGTLYAAYASAGFTRLSSAAVTTKTTASHAGGLQFQVDIPVYQINAAGQVYVPGLTARQTEPGVPDLPYYTTYIALPPDAEVSVQVLPQEVVETTLAQVLPAPDMLFEQADSIGLTAVPQEILHEDATIYGRDALFPDALYTLSDPMYYRDIRLVALHIYPIRYNPVTGQLWQAQQLQVDVTFTGGRLVGLRPSPQLDEKGLRDLILNYDAARAWRSLPAHVLNASTTVLPIGVPTYKIAVNADGIYDVCQPELAAAGMNVGSVNPHTIQMLYRGEPVSYQFIGDADTSFESNECVRFFGWQFDGPRTEKQFVNENIYWLWANGAASAIPTVPNQTVGNLKTSVWFTETVEPELDYFSTWTNQWPTFDNEPDAFYWQRINLSVTSGSYTIALSNPDTTSPVAAQFLAEYSSAATGDYNAKQFIVTTSLNNGPNSGSRNWYGRRNVNIGATIPANLLINGDNTLAATYDLDDRIYLNRVSVSYMRQLIAENDQFILTDETGGDLLQTTGFSSADALVWNITDPLNPIALDMSTGVGGSGPYVYTFGQEHTAGSRFIATTAENVQSVQSITQYTPPNLNPADGRVEWLLITHASLLIQANQLAAHRASAPGGSLDTHIVNIADIINEYGYGLPLPAAVTDYLTYALGSWQIAPSYVVMFGDTTINPRGLPCSQSCGGPGWDLNAPYLVLTALPFADRFQGMVPSDHPFVLLTGNDPLADMKIGRIAVNEAAEATNAINKIIAYEANPFPPPANPPFLFIADNDDPDAGYFCDENEATANHIPGSFTKTHLCLGSPSYPTVTELRGAMFPAISAGVHVVNYRGHGSVGRWATEPIMDTSDTVWWNNTNKPTIILSADCLDAYFAWPGFPGMGETFVRYDFSGNRHGTAAHWSSTGLGFTSEHTVLHAGFYDGVFAHYAQTIGSAIDYAKLNYYQTGHDVSELYTFTLHGDPAMQLYWAPEPPPTPTPSNTPPPGASLTPTPTLTNTPPPGATLTPTPRPSYEHDQFLPIITKP